MKKLMKKKISFFGKEFSVFALMMIGMVALGSAALVPYLSNEVSGVFGVSSPLLLEISDDGSAWYDAGDDMPVSLSDLHGGEIAAFWLQVTNLADVDTEPVLAIVLSSNYGDGLQATCEDFSNVKITAWRMLEGEGSFTNQGVTEGTPAALGCSVVAGEIVLLMPSQYYAGEVEKYDIELTTELNIAPSTYTVVAQEMIPS